MEIKIIKQENDSLFNRENISFAATNTGATPTRVEIRDLIAAKTGKKAENIAVINIKSEFGKNSASGLVHIYKSKEDLDKTEPKYVVKRMLPKEKKKKASAPSEATPTEGETPKEEPAEEKPSEEAPKEEPAEEAKE